MTTYQVQDPQGQVHEFDGPANATPEQILSVAQQQFGNGPHAAPQSPQDAAHAAGIQAGNDENPLTAAVSQAARQATFGGQNYVDAGSRWLGQRLTGVKNPDDFDTDLAYSRGRSEGEVGGHPVASTLGGTAGTLLAGGAVGAAAKGTRFANLLASQPGQKLANVAKAAAVSGAAAGATSLANGDNLPDAGRNAAISAVAGPIVGKVATVALGKLQPASARAMQTLADTIGETPATLQNAYSSFQQLTGRLPSMAELMGLKSQGKLRDLAKVNPTISEAAMTAADMGGRPLHEQLGALNAQGASMPQTAADLTNLRDTEMDTHMNTPHPQTGMTLNETPVNDHTGLLVDPRVEYALRPNSTLDARLGKSGNSGLPPLLDRIQSNEATIGDLETVRKALRGTQASLMSPAPGALNSRSPEQAKEFGDLAMKVEGLGRTTDKDYGLALDNYRAGSQYIDAFQHGMNGKAYNDVPAGDTLLQKSLQSPAGQRGYQHGNALSTANQALQAIAPGSVKTADNGVGPSHVAQAAMGASSGGLSAIYHFMRSIPVVGDRVPEPVQRLVASQLFNPATTQQGINNLTRAGVTSKDLRVLGGAIGGVAGQKIADYLSAKGQ